MYMAFIIPIYPPHYSYAKHIIDSIKESDIYFIFTNHNDFKLFPHRCNYIILEDFITQEQIEKIKNKTLFPSFKKLFGLSLLHGKYDYLCCIDAEVKVIKEPNLKNVYESKVVIGGLVGYNQDLPRNIIRQSIYGLTPKSTHEKLKKISYDCRFYSWWSSMPVYKGSTVPKFIDYIGFNRMNEFIDAHDWFFFDNLAYNYYCLLYEDFKQIVLPNIPHSLEFEGSDVIKKYLIHNIGWLNSMAYNANEDYYDSCKNIYMVYHIDRHKIPQQKTQSFFSRIFK